MQDARNYTKDLVAINVHLAVYKGKDNPSLLLDCFAFRLLELRTNLKKKQFNMIY